jgi:hypothetical protein
MPAGARPHCCRRLASGARRRGRSAHARLPGVATARGRERVDDPSAWSGFAANRSRERLAGSDPDTLCARPQFAPRLRRAARVGASLVLWPRRADRPGDGGADAAQLARGRVPPLPAATARIQILVCAARDGRRSARAPGALGPRQHARSHARRRRRGAGVAALTSLRRCACVCVCARAAAQVLVREGLPDGAVHDVLRPLQRACLLADPADLLPHALRAHDEAADQAHDQIQARARPTDRQTDRPGPGRRVRPPARVCVCVPACVRCACALPGPCQSLRVCAGLRAFARVCPARPVPESWG